MTDTQATNIYFLGIGGIGMSAIARYYLLEGVRVGGYDRTETALTRALASEGADIHYEDDPARIAAPFRNPDDTLVVYTPAIPHDHAETAWFRSRGFRMLKRSEILGVLAADKYVMAVAGTHGKTTTTYLLKAMLEGCLHTKVGLIGTNQNLIGEESLPAHRTTPESYEVQELLREMADAGCTHVVMEASSHALVLHRLDGIPFRAGIFTNLTQDHLDFHGTMEAYRDAKGLLFRQCAAAVLNLDDEAGRYYAETVPVPTFTYSECRDEADLTAKNLRLFPQRVEFEAVTRDAISRVRLPIPGGFTIYNALGVLACGLVLGLPLDGCAAALGAARGVKGRIEVVPTPTDYTVLIDYAHTPDALENILTTVRDFTPGRVICLFGCGGDRDRTKRPRMGAVAGALADVAVVTSDNPRTEVPMDIINDILPGLEGAPAEVVVEPDRRAAIRRALSLARAGDTVVLAGKGHETYQEVDGVEYHLDEREEIAAYFA